MWFFICLGQRPAINCSARFGPPMAHKHIRPCVGEDFMCRNPGGKRHWRRVHLAEAGASHRPSALIHLYRRLKRCLKMYLYGIVYKLQYWWRCMKRVGRAGLPRWKTMLAGLVSSTADVVVKSLAWLKRLMATHIHASQARREWSKKSQEAEIRHWEHGDPSVRRGAQWQRARFRRRHTRGAVSRMVVDQSTGVLGVQPNGRGSRELKGPGPTTEWSWIKASPGHHECTAGDHETQPNPGDVPRAPMSLVPFPEPLWSPWGYGGSELLRRMTPCSLVLDSLIFDPCKPLPGDDPLLQAGEE